MCTDAGGKGFLNPNRDVGRGELTDEQLFAGVGLDSSLELGQLMGPVKTQTSDAVHVSSALGVTSGGTSAGVAGSGG